MTLFIVPTAYKSAAAADSPVIRIGTVGATIGAVDAAYYTGAFAKAGLDVEKIAFSSGSDAIAALVGGSLTFFIGSYEHVLRQIDKGLDVKAYAMISNTQGYRLVTKTDAPYKTLADLKGHAVGVTKVGSLSDTILRRILSEAGLNPERDVEIINGGTGGTMAAALETGNIVAGLIFEPVLSQLVESGRYRVLYYPDFETAGLVLMGRTKWAQENADALRTLLKITQEQNELIAANPGNFVEVFRKDFPDLDDNVLKQAIKNTIDRSPADLVITDAAADDVLKTQLDQKLISREIKKEEAVDASYLP
jgi:ABC-type nitrate/sulfonate/bicarbonate transport system substrate-binding protein